MFQFINSSERTNPYIASRTVRIGKGFFDRQKPFALVAGQLHCEKKELKNLIVFSGPRRTGKTSLLLQLKSSLPKNSFLPIYVDPDGQAATPLGVFLNELTRNIAKETGIELPVGLKINNNGDNFISEFLPLLLNHIGFSRRLLLLIDEFEPLDLQKYSSLPSNVTGKCLYPFINTLTHQKQSIAIVLVTGKNYFQTIDPLEIESHNIWTLNQECAELLIRQSEINQTLSFTDEAVSEILKITNGHPFWIQAICFQIWQQISIQNDCQNIVSKKDVNDAIPPMFQMHMNSCKFIWEGLSHAERCFTEIIAADALPDFHIFSTDQVLEIIRENRLKLTLENLISRHLLYKVNDYGYSFEVPIFLKWVQTKPQHDSKEKNKEGLKEYLTGIVMYDQHRWKESIMHFELALQQQPNHEKSLIKMGMAFLKLNNHQRALELFDQANGIRPKTAPFDLAEGYTNYAEFIQGEQAILFCERALSITEGKYGRALELMRSIALDLGQQEVQKLNFHKARRYFIQADAGNEVEKVDMRISSAISRLVIVHIKQSNIYDITFLGGENNRRLSKSTFTCRFPVSENEQWRKDLRNRGHAAYGQLIDDNIKTEIANLIGAPGNTIEIIIDNPDIPWELLHDGNEFLCLTFPVAKLISNLPSLPNNKKQIYLPKKQKTALIIGVTNDCDESDLNDEFALIKAEVCEIRDLLGTKNIIVKTLLGQNEANLENIIMELANNSYDIIHFAGHGYFDEGNPDICGLKLGDNITLSIKELSHCFDGDSNNSFVFINACYGAQTLTVSPLKGIHDKVIYGIATELLKRNICGCLAPLWRIANYLAKDFAIKFYTEAIHNEESIAEAVRLSRIDFKKREDESPDFWASWVLYGYANHKLV